ncbi:transmembrane prolyl 4-hydroxylase-like [Diadema antillarum]|uniref:transmembrane prolyl 4-hydroxylase-like n=1 Tax=Diadema antillarum TaxID=105358 RepID=UPI003A8BA086
MGFALLKASTTLLLMITFVVGLAFSQEDQSSNLDEGTIDRTNDVRHSQFTESINDATEETQEPLQALYMIDPVAIGYVQNVKVTPYRTVEMTTVAKNPPLFEVRNLISREECDSLIAYGESVGLTRSKVVTAEFDEKYGVYTKDGSTTSYNQTEWGATFAKYDEDANGLLDYKEVQACLPGYTTDEGELSIAEIQRLFLDFDLDADSDLHLGLNEFWAMHSRDVEAMMKNWFSLRTAGQIDMSVASKGRGRISDQTWVDWRNLPGGLLNDLGDRLSGLTKLDPNILQTSEHMQVARYFPGGHYHAHYDTEEFDTDKECIHTKTVFEGVHHTHPKGRLCRYITIMYYLSDVEEGGETAFPLANNETFDQQVYDDISGKICDLSNHCYEANAVVKPEKGMAVMWYNHKRHPQTGWLGPVDKYSLHGGCDVRKGVKWIANNWITVDDVYARQQKLHEWSSPKPSGEEGAISTIGEEDDRVVSGLSSVDGTNERASGAASGSERYSTETVESGKLSDQLIDHADREQSKTEL